MDQPSALLLAEKPTTAPPPPRRTRGPMVERIAGWSARHRKTALFGWLLLIAGAVVIGNVLGTKNLNSYDPGQAGQAERVLARPGVIQGPTETILVQARAGGQTVAGDPEIRQAIGQAAAALRGMPKVAHDVRSALAPGRGAVIVPGGRGMISHDGRSALVTFTVDPRLAASLFQLAVALGLDRVNVLYFGDGKPVGLTGSNDEGQFADCLLMPLS